MGVNEDLTKKQQAAKSAAWPAFLAARAQNKRTSWRAEQLFIDGEQHQLGLLAPPSPPSTTTTATTSVTTTPPCTSH